VVGATTAGAAASTVLTPSMGLSEVTAMKLPKTNEVIAESLIRMLMEGPEVSLSGSPTVSPITAAECSGSLFCTIFP